MRVRLPPPVPFPIRSIGRTLGSGPGNRGSNPRWALSGALSWPVGEVADPPDFGSGVSRFDPWAASNACLVITAARILGKEAVGVQFPEQALCERSVDGGTRPCQGCRGSIPVAHSKRWWRNWQPRTAQTRVSSDVRVRLPPGVLKEHWPSGYGSALLRRTPGNRCEGSSPSCSARGWLADLVRRPVGSRRSRREPWAGSNPAPSAVGDEAAGRQPPFRKRVGDSLSLGFGSSVIRQGRRSRQGAAAALKADGRQDVAGVRVLRLPRSKAAVHLVGGTVLIRRSC